MDAGTEGDRSEGGTGQGTVEDDGCREAEDERELETGCGRGKSERMVQARVELGSSAE